MANQAKPHGAVTVACRAESEAFSGSVSQKAVGAGFALSALAHHCATRCLGPARRRMSRPERLLPSAIGNFG